MPGKKCDNVVVCFQYQIHEKFEDTKGVIKRRKSQGRQYNGQKKNKWISNDLQNTTQKTKERAKQSPLKIEG